MKTRYCLVLLLLLTLGYSQAEQTGFLHASNARIVDGQAGELILRGMGLGGWMLQEGYMLGIRSNGTQHAIKTRIADLIGKADCDKFYQLWLQNHTTRADVDVLAKSGFNSVRLPMHYNLFTLPIQDEPVQGENTWLTTGFELTDNLLAWCKANHMYLILDLHAAPGGQGKDANISDYDPAKPSLWESEANRQKTIALWRKLAERYANEQWIGGYDLLNEPNWTFEGKDKNGKEDSLNQPIWNLYKAITKAIREVDKNHLIIVEGNGWGNNYNGFPGVWDQNLVFSFHKYWSPNTREQIAGFLALRAEYHQPLWLGESGENDNQWFRECVSLVETNHIGWAWWPHKKVESTSCTLTIKRPDDFRKVLDYWNKGGERPTRDTAARGLFQLAESCKASNCRFNSNVVHALIPSGSSTPSRPGSASLSKFKVLALAETSGHHVAFTAAAKPWLTKCGEEEGFDVDYFSDTTTLTEASLARYQLVLQLDFVPYGWKPEAMAAFKTYIQQGRGGWVGLHHATLLGNFDGYAIWPWFSEFMGQVKFKNYIPDFTSGTVHVEDASHPCMKGLPESFLISKEEWYTYDQSPRAYVHVLATVDESSYSPDSNIKMGDHPVIWTNPHVPARNIYIFMGHGPWLFENQAFTTLFRNAILWAAAK
ncbi:MAG TPA: ThuA domain-containing protein [Candidatus Limnocylindrales bacterium]|jgi:aryl-phospho-beta-D-glucosidase BglC (GH1 family)/type 1 glutamine amidotransferase|nr:ThuA domain-containing protein [Candidatus Limnocylindrales bacterium]